MNPKDCRVWSIHGLTVHKNVGDHRPHHEEWVVGPKLKNGESIDVIDKAAFNIIAKQNTIYREILEHFAKLATVVAPNGTKWPLGVMAQKALDQADELVSPQLKMEV